ncbi:MAG: heavy metal-binding domain-containing protein [Adhaeribacter sp.]
MKANILYSAIFAFGLTIFTSCGSEQKETTETTSTEVNQEQAALYTCPMHPEVTSDKPGKCPECKMNLEKVADAGHENHEGHSH